MKNKRSERGYAMLSVLAFLAILILLSAAVSRYLATAAKANRNQARQLQLRADQVFQKNQP